MITVDHSEAPEVNALLEKYTLEELREMFKTCSNAERRNVHSALVIAKNRMFMEGVEEFVSEYRARGLN